MMCTIFITLLLVHVTLSENCYNIENKESGAYTYHICSGTTIRNFNRAKEFCSSVLDTKRTDGAVSHLVTFPNEAEFNFLVSVLNSTEKEDILFYPGIYQKYDSTNRYNPETGEFYWITDDSSPITIDTKKSYWKPFSQWIEDFDSLFLIQRQAGYFLMDKKGNLYTYISLGGVPGDDIDDPLIVCMSEGVQALIPVSTGGQVEGGARQMILETWVVIVIVAGAIFLLILLGVLIGCCISRKRSQFHKVPMDEMKAQQLNHPPPVSQA